jgi:hypothetical protein
MAGMKRAAVKVDVTAVGVDVEQSYIATYAAE